MARMLRDDAAHRNDCGTSNSSGAPTKRRNRANRGDRSSSIRPRTAEASGSRRKHGTDSEMVSADDSEFHSSNDETAATRASSLAIQSEIDALRDKFEAHVSVSHEQHEELLSSVQKAASNIQ